MGAHPGFQKIRRNPCLLFKIKRICEVKENRKGYLQDSKIKKEFPLTHAVIEKVEKYLKPIQLQSSGISKLRRRNPNC